MNYNDTNLLIKHNEKPSSKFGKDPKNQNFKSLIQNGYILIDKDSGPTSHQSLNSLKKILNLEKAGHSGTLDPKVTGLLVCGLENATRLMEYMLKSDKEYVCLMYVHKPILKEEILKIFKEFTGKIKQIPPIISAVKREEREREIYSIKLLEITNSQNVLFKVKCQHGTYIRKLCTDIGEKLGFGAQMKELRRTKAGGFKEEDNIISLDKLRNLYVLYENSNNLSEKQIFEKHLRKYIKPYEELLKDFKKVYVRNSAVSSICCGSDLAIPGVAKLEKNITIGQEVGLFTTRDELIGVGISFLNSEDVIKKNKGAFVKIKKVFMNKETYPKKWEFENK